MLALIALVGTSLAALVWVIRNGRLARDSNVQISAVNRAVNDVGPGEHRLYDKVTHNSETLARVEDALVRLQLDQETFDSHGWETLPQDINTAVGLTTTIRDLQNGHKKLDKIIAMLSEHVEWEIGQKHSKD